MYEEPAAHLLAHDSYLASASVLAVQKPLTYPTQNPQARLVNILKKCDHI